LQFCPCLLHTMRSNICFSLVCSLSLSFSLSLSLSIFLSEYLFLLLSPLYHYLSLTIPLSPSKITIFTNMYLSYFFHRPISFKYKNKHTFIIEKSKKRIKHTHDTFYIKLNWKFIALINHIIIKLIAFYAIHYYIC
jgi:hypothetical protein